MRVQQYYQQWQEKGLFLFFLPPYSPQMNRIEDEWLHLKRDELAGRVFEDEYDLSVAIRKGIEAYLATIILADCDNYNTLKNRKRFFLRVNYAKHHKALF